MEKDLAHSLRSPIKRTRISENSMEMEMFNIYIAHFLYGYNQMRFTTLSGGLYQTAPRSSQFYEKVQYDTPAPPGQNK